MIRRVTDAADVLITAAGAVLVVAAIVILAGPAWAMLAAGVVLLALGTLVV